MPDISKDVRVVLRIDAVDRRDFIPSSNKERKLTVTEMACLNVHPNTFDVMRTAGRGDVIANSPVAGSHAADVLTAIDRCDLADPFGQRGR